jgi:hypothetical protein
MATRLGLYMNARRAIEGTGDLNGNAVTNVEQLVGLRDAGRLDRVDVLIRLSRDLAEHRRQSEDGLDSTVEPMWEGVREFRLDEIHGARLTPGIGRVPRGSGAKMLTAPGLASFLHALAKGADPATTTLVLWGHADGPSGVLFARPPGLATPANAMRPAPAGRVARRAGAMARDQAPGASGGNHLARDILSPADAQKAFAGFDVRTGKLGLICFDACQAACIEFASLLAPHAELLIASQTPVPGAGWNYGSWPALLSGISKSKRKARAVAIAADFAKSQGRNLSISVTDLSKVPAIVAALKPVSDALIASQSLRAAFRKVRARVPTPDRDVGGTVDLIGLFTAAGSMLAKHDAVFARHCDRVAAAARRAIAIAHRSADIPKRVPLEGLSIYYPTPKSGLGDLWDDITDQIYFGNPNQLRAFKASRWHEFLAQDRRDRDDMPG